ncbi:chymotrypsin-2-like [Pseudomyrmex gracilis]|uniref:chymotrypsin-2-like n=1 Tax=Pseudomyrmex gracilis TaxID=219809 RepID=UPI0009950C8F|nr:chymotrypsin-2-like [Pseudomyrmex gracilis]
MFVGLIIACFVMGVSGDTHIIGGKNATAIYPYQVSLRSTKERHFCGGAIIDKRFILTAAHCLQTPIHPSNTSVAVGSNNLLNATLYPAEAFFVHKKYNIEPHLNDIGLIRVSKDIKFNKFVQPINLSNYDRNYENVSLVATGWGLWNNNEIPTNLQELTVKGYSQEKCATFYRENVTQRVVIKETQICTLNRHGQGMCNVSNYRCLL